LGSYYYWLADEYEKLCIATQKHLLERLAKTHSNISSLDLQLIATEYEGNKPEPRFHVFVKAKAAICFSKVQPEPKDFHENLLAIFDRAYLLDAVRTIPSPFASAVEVQAQRLKRPTIGGAIKALAFYLAPATPRKVFPKVESRTAPPPQKNPTPQKKFAVPKPTPRKTAVSVECVVFTAYQLRNQDMKLLEQEDYKALLSATYDFYTDHLMRKYGSKFMSLSIAYRYPIQWGKANKSDPFNNYNVYIEWKLEATFLLDTDDEAPSGWELTQSMVAASCTKYMKRYVRPLSDTPFARTTAVFTRQYAA
jgi:hypothetical protein